MVGVGIFCLTIYLLTFFMDADKATDELMISFNGYLLLIISSVQYGMGQSDNRKFKCFVSQKSNRDNTFSLYPVVPIRKKEYLDYDFMLLNLQYTVMTVALAAANIASVVNTSELNGFFVILTFISILCEVMEYMVRYYNIRVCSLIWMSVLVLYVIAMVINLFDSMNNVSVFSYIWKSAFLNDISGVPMIIVSIIWQPALIIHYIMRCCKTRKQMAWY